MSGSSRRNRVLSQGSVDLAARVARMLAEFPDLAFERATPNDLGEDHAVVVLDDACVFRFPRNAEVAAHAAMERHLLDVLKSVSPIDSPPPCGAGLGVGVRRPKAATDVSGLFSDCQRSADTPISNPSPQGGRGLSATVDSVEADAP